VHANTCTEAGYNELANIWHESAQQALEFERVVFANRMSDAYFYGPFRYPFRDVFGKARNALMRAKHKTTQAYLAAWCCADNRGQSQKIGNDLYRTG